MGSVLVECGLTAYAQAPASLSHPPPLSLSLVVACFLPPFKAHELSELSPRELLCLFLEFAQEVTPALLFRFLLRHQCFPGRPRNRVSGQRQQAILTDREAGRCRPGLTSSLELPALCPFMCLLVS